MCFPFQKKKTQREMTSCKRLFRALWSFYFQDAIGVIFVVDCADKERLGEARRELHRVMRDGRFITSIR